VKRWAWHIFCALSLLIFATSVTIWVRSYFVSEYGRWARESQGSGWWIYRLRFDLTLSQGSLLFRREQAEQLGDYPDIDLLNGWYYSNSPSLAELYPAHPRLDATDLHFAGFRLVHSLSGNADGSWRSVWVFAAPLWLFLIFALPPLLWWRKWRKRNTRGFPLEAAGASDAHAGGLSNAPQRREEARR